MQKIHFIYIVNGDRPETAKITKGRY